MTRIHRVLWFCAGNTCRSPFAEYFSKWLQKNKYKEDLKEVVFDSAGIYHYYDRPQEGTVNYLKSKNIDISDFKAKRIDEKLLKKQDLIIGFERKRHIDKLKRKYKNLQGLDNKLFLLLEFAGETENLDIKDPFNLDQNEYKKVLQRIENGVIKVVERIIKINKLEEDKP
ncbi:MAG: hypothetical protein ACFFBH_04475 [Promethearchaeota archaeon]